MAKLDTRYSFAPQNLLAANYFAACAKDLELNEHEFNDDLLRKHRAYVVGAVMQSTACLEAEAAELLTYGPGHQLGSNGLDMQSRDFLNPLADLVDRQPIIDRFSTILHLLKKDQLDKGSTAIQNVTLLIRLRNELVHYKSIWGRQMEQKKLFTSLRQLQHMRPSFLPPGMNYFPHECLSADCAEWSWRSVYEFYEVFFEKLEFENPFKVYRSQLY